MVIDALNHKAKNVVIDREHEGEDICRALLKNVFDIFIEIGMAGWIDCYEKDFERTNVY